MSELWAAPTAIPTLAGANPNDYSGYFDSYVQVNGRCLYPAERISGIPLLITRHGI